MITARSVHKTFLAIIFLGAALVFPINTWAASGNGSVCQPNANCTIGEFLYDDSYAPIANASCTVTSRYPDGTQFLNNVSATAASDGWYSYAFSAPATTGLYRSQLCCTVSGSLMCLDKSFEVKTQSSLSQGEVASAVWNANRSSYKSSGSFGEGLQNIVPSANDIAQAAWGYSTRTVTSFGTLVNDIWNSASNTTTTQQLTTIKTETQQTRQILEQVVNKPIIQTSLQEDKTPNLQSKLNETKTRSDQLLANTQYIRSKTSLIDARWKSLQEGGITRRLDEISQLVGQDSSSNNSLISQVNWLNDAWDWQEVQGVYTQTKDAKAKLSLVRKELDSSGASPGMRKNMSSLVASLDTLALLETPLFGKIQQVREFALALDQKSSDIDRLLAHWGSYTGVSEVNNLSKEVRGLNKITKADFLLTTVDQTSSEKNRKNKVLDLQGVVDANKKLLAKKAGTAFASTWLSEGSIIFKSLVTNPSQLISQTVPVTVYLPMEVKKENIIKVDDGLSVSYDAEKNQYYYQGEFTLLPGETKTLQVRVDDSIFTISQEEIASMRKQAEDLSKPLNNTSYFAQGVSLKSDIDVALDKVIQLQKTGVTPDAKIRAYREAQIELAAARTTTGKLKELASTAGSAGTLFGFVGGTQTLAVWGLIIIMVAGFVFLALYMRELRKNETAGRLASVSVPAQEHVDKHAASKMQKPRARLKPLFKLAMFLLVFGVLGGFVSGIVVGVKIGATNKSSNVAKDVKNASGVSKDVAANKTNASSEVTQKEVLGNKSSNQVMSTDKKFRLFVPSDGLVNLYKSPSLDSPVVVRFKTQQAVVKKEEQGQWVKIAVTGQTPPVEGWVDKDFVEESLPEPTLVHSRKVIIDESLSGFVWVREKPLGEQLAKVYPGDELILVQDADEWLQVELANGTLGWISRKYTSFR